LEWREKQLQPARSPSPDQRIYPKNKYNCWGLVRRTQNPEPSSGGKSVVIHLYFSHYINYFTFAYLLSTLALEK
jgi:hypothetical protein